MTVRTKKRTPLRPRFWLALGGILLVLMTAEWRLCRAFPAVSAVCRTVAQAVSAVLSRVAGIFPFPLSEWIIGGLVLGWSGWLVYTLARRRWQALLPGLSRLLCMGCAAAFLFVALYGVHHTAPTLASQMGLTVEKHTAAQLEALVEACVKQVNALAPQAPRGQDNRCDFGDFRQLAALVSEEYGVLKTQWPVFDRPPAGLVKRSLLGGRIMSYIDLAGYYFPWAAESTVSSDVVQTHIPFNIAHETAHGLGIGPEAECNFAAWLACKDSEDVRLRYSGWLCGYAYASNALYAADYEAWYRQAVTLCDEARLDLQVLNEKVSRFEDTVTNKIGSAANDALIKATGQSDGIRSYGRVVDLMLAYFYEYSA